MRVIEKKIGGETVSFRLNHAALEKIEQRTGMGFLKMINSLEDGRVSILIAILECAGHEGKGAPSGAGAAWMDDLGFGEATALIGDLIQGFMPSDDGAAGDAAPEAGAAGNAKARKV